MRVLFLNFEQVLLLGMDMIAVPKERYRVRL